MKEIFNRSLLRYLPFGIISIFLVVSRFWNFSLLPAALTHDEVVYAIQAKSLAVQSAYLNQQDSFFSLEPAHPMYAELPAILMSPFFSLISDPIVATRMLAALISIGFPFVLAWFSYGLWKKKTLSIMVFIVSIFNPLLWQMGRLTYDAVLSTFFYLLGGAILLNTSGKKVYTSIPLLLLGFFQYQGYKLLFLPWVFFLGAVIFIRNSKGFITSTHLLSLAISLLILPIYIGVIMPNQSLENRWEKTIFANEEYQSARTNDERRQTLTNPIIPLMSNKLTVVGKFMTSRLLGAFSPSMLFLSGEPAQSGFSAWGYGWFHAVDLLLILIGMGYMWAKKYSRLYILPIGLIIVAATFPSLINSGEPWYLLRMFLPNVLLLLFVAWGAWFLWESKVGKLLLIVAYSISIFLFSYHFYFRYPIVGNHISYLSEKLMAEYVDRIRRDDADQRIFVHTVDPPVMFWTYLLYADAVNESTVDQIAAAKSGDEYVFDNIVFTGKCADITQKNAIIMSEAFRPICDYSESKTEFSDEESYGAVMKSSISSKLTIPSIVDNGAQWRIYNDVLCSDFDISGFVHIKTYNQFDINSQDNRTFCQTWVTRVI